MCELSQDRLQEGGPIANMVISLKQGKFEGVY